jgi:transcriptional regulator with XRE-family HTH domain
MRGAAELRLLRQGTAPPEPACEDGRCRHCAGSGREPAPLRVEFSRSGDLRGEQARMAEAIDSSASMVSMIFSGERAPGVLTLIRIARYLGTTVDRVLRVPAIWRRVHQEPAE